MGFPSAKELATMTPMMRQYYELKKDFKDGVLFLRMGDFYEIFGDDAKLVAPKLDIALTSKDQGGGEKTPFCGVPHHSAKPYWLKLLKLGYKVAIGNQMEEASKTKKLVKRAIVKVYTPGCIDDLDGLQEEQPNYLMAFYESPDTRKLAVAISDVSTGELRAEAIEDLSQLLVLVQKFRPKELVARKFFHSELTEVLQPYLRQETLAFGSLSESLLRDPKEQETLLQSCLGETDLEPEVSTVVASILSYFKKHFASIETFSAVKPLNDPETISIDTVARRDLELFETVRRRSREGSLFHEINRTLSPMGARLLLHSLQNPFCQEEPIVHRQNGVALLLSSEEYLDKVRELLKGTPDLERLATRVLSCQASPRELSKVRSALDVANKLSHIFSKLPLAEDEKYRPLINDLKKALAVFKSLESALAKEPTDLGEKLGVIAEGYDPDFDQLRLKAQNGEQEIKKYEESLRKKTQINSLKVKPHKTYGLLIEVTKSNLSKVPEDFIRRQTMVNNERFITIELKELDESLSQAKDLATAREAELFGTLLKDLGSHYETLKLLGQRLGLFDLLQSFAYKAIKDDYTRPVVSKTGHVKLAACRHPVVESFVGRHDFIPNDIHLDPQKKSLVITGPNMGGKSTIMRQTALCAILHQIGSYLPCTHGELPIFDGIYTRVGASDDLALGQSTFMVEMSETAAILRLATSRSLVILDEVGRGTSTEDGMAIALAILEELSSKVGCYLMFATHFYELLSAAEKIPAVKIVQAEVLEGDTIQFTHRLKDGAAGSSFGIEVAKLAGVPASVIEKASGHLQLKNNQPSLDMPSAAKPEKPIESVNKGSFLEFEGKQNVLDRISQMNLNRTTPLQALKRLYELQEMTVDNKQFSLFND